MPQPKKRHSRSRQGKRRLSNWTISAPTLSSCSQCGQPTLAHRLCKACGNYQGRTVIDYEAMAQKKADKKKKEKS